MSQILRERHEIPQAHTWDTESIFPSVDAWETAVEKAQADIKKAEQFKGRLAEGPAVLADYLEFAEQLLRQVSRASVYASLNYSVNTEDQEAAGRNDRGRGLFGQLAAATAFAQPEMIAIGFDTLRDWQTQEPRLAIYTHYFERLETQSKHIRSAEVEQLLGMVQDAFRTASSTHPVLANAELKFKAAVDSDGNEYDVAQASIRNLLGDQDRTLRRSAWENYADEHLAYKNTMANALAAGVKQNVFMARARGYNSALEASTNSDFIPTEVFHNLIDTFKANLGTWHRYWAIRRKALGYDKLYEYDLKAPLSLNPPQVSYEQAVDYIAEGMSPLGEEYTAALRRGCLEERWVDIYPNKGKRMGAFSSGTAGTHPFIFMSFTEDLFGMSTLAHELGHSMHSYFTRRSQPIVPYMYYGLFAAEVASNFNQAMVRAYLLEKFDDPEFQIAVIEEAMANFYRYFYIMPTLARFELAIHERVEKGQALSANYLNSLLADLIGEVYGDEVELDRDRSGITWAEFHTHMYANFYVYKYATGISGAHALAYDILGGKEAAVENYLKFLHAGGSMYPMDVLKMAGVDMSSPEPVEKTFAMFADLVDRLEVLVDQRK